jgi:hypothetical protein
MKNHSTFNPNAEVGRDGALRRPRRRAQRQATERMAMRASYPARFVTPAPRGRGQRSPLSSTIFATAISEFRFNIQRPMPEVTPVRVAFIGCSLFNVECWMFSPLKHG